MIALVIETILEKWNMILSAILLYLPNFTSDTDAWILKKYEYFIDLLSNLHTSVYLFYKVNTRL